MKKSKRAAIIGGLIAFVLPLLFIGKIVSTAKKYRTNEKHNYMLPILGERSFDELTEDTVYHQVKKFKFRDFAGNAINNEYFKIDVRLVSFADTSSVDNQITFLRPILEFFPKKETADRNYANLHIVQHIVVPQNGGASVQDPEMENWHMVARSKFKNLPESYLLTENQMALVDQDGRIRGKYKFEEQAMEQLKIDIQHLLRETYYTNKRRNRRVKFSE